MGTAEFSESQFMTILYCGDPHGRFQHIIGASGHLKASAVILLGDMEPQRPLDRELAALVDRAIPIWYIHGNHDADTDELWTRVWGSKIADRNIHGRVVELPNGQRLAGLGGVFRESVWYPLSSATREEQLPRYRTRKEHARATPRRDRCGSGPPTKHWGTIYPEDVDRLANLRADVLITHEAPRYHPNGFELLDILAQSMGAKVVVHGHHHDRLDSSYRWTQQGFKSYGVGLRGITAIDEEGSAKVIVPGELDEQRDFRQRYLDVFEKPDDGEDAQ
jgi:predicted phosphodiesterase